MADKMDVKTLIVVAFMFSTNVLANSEGFTYKGILRRIEELEKRDRSQQSELEILRTQNLAMEREINQLKDRDAQQTHRIEVLEENEQIMRKVITGLMNDIKDTVENTMEVKPNDSGAQLTPRTIFHKGNEDATKSSNRRNRIRQVENKVTVAFFATLTNHAEHLGHNQAIRFDNGLTNIGQAYNPHTGVFTAPVSGVYVFSATIVSNRESALFGFVVNNVVMSHMYAYSTEAYETLSMTAIFNLTPGNEVAIWNEDSDNLVQGLNVSSFSGFLLA